jgi:hypothetical protein
MRNILSATMLCLCSGCGPIQDLKIMGEWDLLPPTLMSVLPSDSESLLLTFDEPTSILDPPAFSPALELHAAEQTEGTILLHVAPQLPGIWYAVSLSVEDRSHNSTHLVARFLGYNSDVPSLRINEFTVRGSRSHPDIVEIKVHSDGNMGGVVLYQGTDGVWKDRLVFPPFRVLAGCFVLVHFKPQGIPEEVDETVDPGTSGGLDASDHAFDFWLEDGTGLGANNGVISLYERPGGSIMDGVLYSNRTSDSDSRYLGFGTRAVMEWALELRQDRGWKSGSGRIRPEDGVDPDGSSATRSLCRRPGDDTDTRADWYIVPTRHSSFGEENSLQIFERVN